MVDVQLLETVSAMSASPRGNGLLARDDSGGPFRLVRREDESTSSVEYRAQEVWMRCASRLRSKWPSAVW